MLAILSPAKSLDYESELITQQSSQPQFVSESQQLIQRLRKHDPAQLASLMKISDTLAELNHRRYAEWTAEFDSTQARPAVLAFKGDVYLGLDAYSLSADDLNWAQQHLRILSGLHGMLRPLDAIQPYRLEMGTPLATSQGKNLYEFWGTKVTDALNEAIDAQRQKILLNLASNEYFKVVDKQKLDARVINIHFKEWKNGQYKIISFYAKKARGAMARYLIEKRVDSLELLQAFDHDNYSYQPAMSTDQDWVFTRKQPIKPSH